MNLARFSVKRPVTAGIISVALFVLGLFYLIKMPVSLYPEVSFPFISVTVPYPGASPEQIESAIIKPIEAEVAGLKKISRVIGYARPGYGQLILAFKMSADEQEAADAVREKVSIVKGRFPQGSKEPIVARVDVGATPILIFGVETERSADETLQILEDRLLPELRRTEGVNEAKILGIGEERLQLTLDAKKLSDMRVAPLDIFEQLSAKMAVIPWGEVTQSEQVLSLSRRLLPADPTYWSNQRVTLRDGRTIFLGDVGDIKSVRDDKASSVFINGHRGLGLVITKRADANTVSSVKAVKKTLAKVELPKNLKLFSIVDQSSFIQENSQEVWIALFAGGAFAVLIILLFLTDWRSALISATALPVSIAGSFIFMSWFDFSINMMSLLAMALAIGLLIDDAVVVRESIYTELEKGASPSEAAVRGTDRVAAAVIATSLAVIAVFLPVAGMDGMVGQFFKQFGMTICIAVAISTWVAFTLDPMLSAHFAGHPRPFKGVFWERWRGWLTTLETSIARWAVASFRRPKTVIAIAVATLLLSIGWSLSRGSDFLAFEDRGQFIINIRGQAGRTREHNEALAAQALERVKDLDGLQDIFVTVGERGDENLIQMRLVFVAKTKRKTGLLAMQSQARERLRDLSGDVLVMDPPPIEGIGGEAPLSVYVYGENLIETRKVAEELLSKIRAVPGIGHARLETAAFARGMDIELKPLDVGFSGSATQALELTGRMALTGLETGFVGEKNIPFMLRLSEQDRNLQTLLNQVYVPSLRGPMALSQLADLQETERPLGIDRERRSRKMVIWGTLDRSQTYGVVLGNVQKLVDAVRPPFSAEIQGDKEVFEEMVSSFTLAIIGSLFFIFVILAAQFENLLRPFVILLSLPLAIIGGFVGLSVTGHQLALGSLIGMVFLIGLAAKNGILLVDAIGVKEKSMSLIDAVRDSVRERSRAILMTSIAMIFGMIPTAVMRGGGSEFRSPMAIAIIGGVISSTILSFFVVPAVFGVIEQFRLKRRQKDVSGSSNSSNSSDSADSSNSSEPSGLSVTSGGLGTLVLVFGFFFCSHTPAWATSKGQASSSVSRSRDANDGKPVLQRTNMRQVVELIGALKPDGPEAAQIEGAESAAQQASRAAVESVLGGARVEYGVEWFRPGYSQTVTLPLPPPVGTLTNKTVIVPTEQRVLSLGWQIPLVNLQALYGWVMRAALREQADKIREAKIESSTIAAAQLLLQTELAVQTTRVNQSFAEISKARSSFVAQRLAAGLSTQLEFNQAEAGRLAAVAQWEQTKAEELKIKQQFVQQVGKNFPESGIGLTQFPFVGQKPFRSAALEAIQAVYVAQVKSAELSDASFYPQLSLEFGYSKKAYDGSPPAQKFAAVKARWDLLDGGSRSAVRGRNSQMAFDVLAQVRQLENQLKSSYETLSSRLLALERARTAAEFGLKAAAAAQQQAMQSYQAGLLKAIDVRSADEAKLKADFALLQLEFALQGLALESLALTGSWNGYIRAQGEETAVR
jgi:multidrug efflux pump subunit AcrB/outer membrane protein TolC